MSKKMKFTLNLPGLNEVMKSPAMQSELEQKGAQIASAAKVKRFATIEEEWCIK